MTQTPPKKYLLKDMLFNKKGVARIANEIKAVYKPFKEEEFQKEVLAEFPNLELMERLLWIQENLKKYLPNDYQTAVNILIKSLPPETDNTKTDDDFGAFIYGPYGYFVALEGCTKKDLNFSLQALRTFTMRFSAEGPIRYFINAFPKETIEEMLLWADDTHYHVRRLASEGSRPLLPWAKKIDINPEDAVPVLDKLFSDKTRFVTRSVANHLNDISKINPELTLSLLKKWKKSKKQSDAEMSYIISHSLRTLIKTGNKQALEMLGYTTPEIKVPKIKLETKNIKVGESLIFTITITSASQGPQKLMIDYSIGFMKANGKLAPKTFKLAKKTLEAGESITLIKKHPLKLMSTRRLYAGEHSLSLQINGVKYKEIGFELTS